MNDKNDNEKWIKIDDSEIHDQLEQLPKDWVQYNLEQFRKLQPEFREKAVLALRNALPENIQRNIRTEITKDPQNWIAPYHFAWGMGTRNFLRDQGLLDNQLPEGDRGNWDDYYVAIAEVAVKAGIYDLLDSNERV